MPHDELTERVLQTLENIAPQEEHFENIARALKKAAKEHPELEKYYLDLANKFLRMKEMLRATRKKLVGDILLRGIPKHGGVLREFGCVFKHQPCISKGLGEISETLFNEGDDALSVLDMQDNMRGMFYKLVEIIKKEAEMEAIK